MHRHHRINHAVDVKMKRVGISYQQHKPDENYDCIVIGSDIGGFTDSSASFSAWE